MKLPNTLGRALMLLAFLLPVTAGGAGTGVPKGGLWAGKTTLPWSAGEVDALVLVAENGRGYGRAYFALGNILFIGQAIVTAGGLYGQIITGQPLQGMPPPPTTYVGLRWRPIGGTVTLRKTLDAWWCSGRPADPDICPSRWPLALKYQASYDANSSLARIAGTYREARGQLAGVLSIASNGRLFLQDPASGCVFNGHVAVINANFNAYDIGYSYGNCKNRALNGAIFSGLATIRGSTGELVAVGWATQTKPGTNVRIPANVYVFARQ